jgi:hypothetical protein
MHTPETMTPETVTPETDQVDVGGGGLLAAEAREEIGRLISHPVDEVRRLEHVAADGDSASTPLLLVFGVGALVLAILAVVTAVALVVYYAS